jgi:protein required for attachment to host cells
VPPIDAGQTAGAGVALYPALAVPGLTNFGGTTQILLPPAALPGSRYNGREEQMVDERDPRLWVLVADGERARVLTPETTEGRFTTCLRLGTVEGAHCPPPLRNQSLDDARNGFAADVAHRLDDEARDDTYDRLVVVAPGRVLHDVREAVGQLARSRLVGTVMAECVGLDDQDVSRLVAQWWRAPAEAA